MHLHFWGYGPSQELGRVGFLKDTPYDVTGRLKRLCQVDGLHLLLELYRVCIVGSV